MKKLMSYADTANFAYFGIDADMTCGPQKEK